MAPLNFKMIPIFILCNLLVASVISYEAPDDCDWHQIEDGGVALTCHLSAINSHVERTNFSVIPSQGLHQLTIRCTDSTLSSLQSRAFANLKELQELNIENCKFETLGNGVFGGLNQLLKLKLKFTAFSTELQFEKGTFRGMPNLQQLDLSNNKLRSLPKRELCNLPELQVLNLSSNQIGSISDILSSVTYSEQNTNQEEEECFSRLDILDLSNNEITSLDDNNSPILLHKLHELKLNKNFIRHLTKLPVSGNQLEILDLSENQISDVPSDFFQNASTTIRVLNLANNSLVTLKDSIFSDMQVLEVLNLSGNKLSSGQLSRRHFSKLSSLRELDLSSNKLALSLESELFTLLHQIEVLKLNNNQLENLPTFQFNQHLHTLDLTNNRLKSLESNTLTGLVKLTHLYISKNSIVSLADEAFKNTSEILVLDLSHNRLNEAPEALRQLKVLQTLDLSFNGITTIEDAPILDMAYLWRLQLSNNHLRNVTLGLLNKLQSLQILDVSSNAISLVERGAFDANSKLQAIRLDNNQLTTMDGLFQNLPHLTWLNISSNKIAIFDYALVPRKLHWLDLSHNLISELGNYFDLTSEVSTAVLDLSFNSIKQLGPNNIPDSIETLLINDNQLEQIVPYTFFKKARLTKVDLTVNNLKSIDRNALRLSSEIEILPDFYLGGNPIECDCNMVWFKTINSANSLQQNYPIIQDIESIYCRLVYTREVSFVPLVEARNEQFLCPYETHCFALCKCCDFDACDCEMSCPDNCTCYHDNSWSKNIAVCSAQEFTDLPEQLPMDATEIFLDGNVLSELGSHTFIGRKNLRILHLNNSQIHTIRNKTFNGLHSLTVLHLESNQLTSLKGFEFETLSNLRELYLQNNLISSIHEAAFKHLRSLEVLHLQGNRIIDFPVWQLAFNPFLVSVKLAENLWSCQCEYMERFRSWMSVYSSKIFDSELIRCVTNEADSPVNEVRMVDFDVSSCSANMNGVSTSTRIQEISGVREEIWPFVAAILASFAVVLLLILAAFVYRHTLRVWIHSKYGVRVFDSSFNDDDHLMETGSSGQGPIMSKLFDIFVSYSPKDDPFVRDVLAPELEAKTGSSHNIEYKVCLHHRDVASQNYVADTICQATEASRRSILILSENFLKSEWSRYDYKSGLHQAMRSTKGRKKLIVILLGDITSRDMDPDLRLYLKTSIVLQWGDKLFWEKLRYVLPDTPMSKLSESNKSASDIEIRPNMVHYGGINTISNSINDNVEEHYYQQPRYASYMPPPQPLPNLPNNESQFYKTNNLNNSHISAMAPAYHHNRSYSSSSSSHPSTAATSPIPHHLPSTQNIPTGQTLPGRTVIMHI